MVTLIFLDAPTDSDIHTLFNHKNQFIMYVIFFEYKYFALKNEWKHKSKNTVEKKRLSYQPERGTKKAKTLPTNNMAENQNMINIGLLHICRL